MNRMFAQLGLGLAFLCGCGGDLSRERAATPLASEIRPNEVPTDDGGGTPATRPESTDATAHPTSSTLSPAAQWNDFLALVAAEPQESGDCLALVGHAGEWESCEGTAARGNDAGIIRVVTECGGDSCSIVWWYVSPKLGVVKLPGDDGRGGSVGGGTTAFTPSGDELVTDVVGLASPSRLDSWTVRLVRITPSTREVRPFAECMSPTLAPDGRSYACRNRRGDLLRLPLNGGTPRLIARSGLDEAEVYWVPYGHAYPGPAELDHGTATFRTERQPPAPPLEKRARWP